jgi:site-specific recombinase XerD
MPRKARAIPVVIVKSRHRSKCKFYGDGHRITCNCPKQLVWSRNSKEHRVTADTCDYEVAERKAREMEQSFERAARGEPAPIRIDSVTVEEAVTRFLATKQTEGVGSRHMLTLRKTFAKDLLSYCNEHGLMHIRDIRLTDLEDWRDSWKLGKTTAQKTQSRVVGFFDFCLRREWLDKNVARSMGKIRLKEGDRKPTIALDDKQFEQLLAAIPKVNGCTTDEVTKRLRALTLLQRWTGLAIGDACKLERKRIEKDPDNHGWHRLFVRRSKTGTPVFAAIAGNIAEQILAAPNDNPRFLFTRGANDTQVRSVVQRFTELYVKMDKVADIKNEHGEHIWIHSHMLRDTYAVWLLEHGAPTEDVAALLGHSSIAVTEKHYLPFIEMRAKRMSERVKAAYQNWQEEKVRAAKAS